MQPNSWKPSCCPHHVPLPLPPGEGGRHFSASARAFTLLHRVFGHQRAVFSVCTRRTFAVCVVPRLFSIRRPLTVVVGFVQALPPFTYLVPPSWTLGGSVLPFSNCAVRNFPVCVSWVPRVRVLCVAGSKIAGFKLCTHTFSSVKWFSSFSPHEWWGRADHTSLQILGSP